MHRVTNAVLVMLGLFILGGPAFGAAGLVSGAEVTVTGGPTRVAFDLIVGAALVTAGTRQLRATPQLTQ